MVTYYVEKITISCSPMLRHCLISLLSSVKINYWKVKVKLIYLPYFDNQSFTHSNSKSWDLFSNPEELNNYSVRHSEVKDAYSI